MNKFRLSGKHSGNYWNRRKFVNALIVAGGFFPLLVKSASARGASQPAGNSGKTVQQIIDMILAEIPGAPFKQTVDTVKAGDANQQVRGIVTTMFPTDAVIEKAAKLGSNFIIAHEPSFYNHLDDTSWLEYDEVYKFKADLLRRNGIAIWRFHDYIHSHRPDGVRMGVLTALGWEKYYDSAKPQVLTIPASRLGDVIDLFKDKLGISKLRFMGDLNQQCKRIAISPGAAGGRPQIETIRREKPDLFVCGELNEWETSEYVRDLRYMGSPTALLVLGHIVSEEPGMQWLVDWLQPKIPAIPITHIPSKDAFTWA
mgnify:CR=1 FL=1